ncbi:caspase-1-like [Tiliqua scincoides]|uniref:caspase-1-like n=1 Tax=Tiliqua scincoides TaxID=71010 RepID=UPI003461B27D
MADKKLEELRCRFVEGANNAVISQLLDDLLEKKVLNEEEAEEVKQAPRRQQQARTLIDHARRKGVRASQVFIESLQCRDPCLTEQLGLKEYCPGAQICLDLRMAVLPQPAPRGSRSREDAQPLESSQGIKLCPPDLFRKIQAQEGNDIYPILDPKERSRLALIICNINFAHLSERKGAEVDLAEMRRLLEGLGYTVDEEKDLCSQGMVDCLQRFAARKEHKTSDSTFVVLMTHGLRDGLCGVDSQGGDSDLLSIDTIFSTFNNRNCQALRGKPKVIIIQACRGENRGVVYMSDSGAPSTASLSPALWPPREFEHDAVQIVHLESDFICLQSTTPDTKSWRRPKTGSVFLTELREQLQEHAWECHLEEVFRKVLLSFEKNPLQMPSKDRTTLSRKFYLFPGH